MNCPVCGATIREIFCPQCGFDTSADAQARPTLTRIDGAASIAARRAAWEKAHPPETDGSYAIRRPPSGREPVAPPAARPEPQIPETTYAWKPENGQRKVERLEPSEEAQRQPREAADRPPEPAFVPPAVPPSPDARAAREAAGARRQAEERERLRKQQEAERAAAEAKEAERKALREQLAEQEATREMLRDSRRGNLIRCIVSAALFALCCGIYKAAGDFLSLGFFLGAATIICLGAAPIVLIVNLIGAAANGRKILEAKRQAQVLRQRLNHLP